VQTWSFVLLFKFSAVKAPERVFIGKAEEAYKILLQSWDMDSIQLIEHFKIMLFNKSNRLLGINLISRGGISSAKAFSIPGDFVREWSF